MTKPPGSPWVWALVTAAVPALLAVTQLGRIHPDEVYQTLEPAYHRAFGYGILAWEWQSGLRNWAIPLLFSWLLRLCGALGIDHPVTYRTVLEVPQYLLHAWALLAIYRYTARKVDERWALLSVPLVGLYAPVLTFAGRTLGESFSTAFLLIALEALDREGGRARDGLLGGAMLGLSVVARYPSAVVVLAAMGWLLATRRWRMFSFAAVGGLGVALALGALDWATWGKPFHSLEAYLKFNVFSDEAAQRFGRDPASYYLGPLLGLAALWSWPGLVLAAQKLRPRLSLPLICALVYVGAITLTSHKEHRFLYPALVLLALAAAPGLLVGLERLHRIDVRSALAALAVAASVAPFFFETALSVQRSDQFRAIVRATRGDATGFLLVGDGIWGAGGHFYLGKHIPWTVADAPHDPGFRLAMSDRRFNRVVTYDGLTLEELKAHGFTETGRIGRATMLAR
ncbi:MAG: glycosyltransferase family 39 protein [Myxococcota bacterium]